MLAIELIGL